MVGAKAGAEEQEGRVKDGITFDTGARIALERRGQRARKVADLERLAGYFRAVRVLGIG